MIVEKFPRSRLRRTRKFSWSRSLVRENTLSVSDFIFAAFVCEGTGKKSESDKMPGVYIYSLDVLLKGLSGYVENGLKAVMLFPKVPKHKKSKNAEESYNPDNLVCLCIRNIKKHYPGLGIICDVALDPYTLDGHDGLVDDTFYVLNDATVDVLCKQALIFANAGCNIIAPSDMMDGRVGRIRDFLDAHDMQSVQIMSYSAKFSSNFYNPFREVVGSIQEKPICKKNYQMDFANSDESMREIFQDIEEGADYIIVKPSMMYLDIVRKAADNFQSPIVVYNVSGEYGMLMAGVRAGLFDRDKIFYETYVSMKRAGAKIIIVYNFDLVLEIIRSKTEF